MTGVFLQVRLDSARLPRKALLRLAGVTVIEHAMLALRRVSARHHVVVTDEVSSQDLEPLAVNCGFDLFVGPADDVLARFVFAGRKYGVTRVVRATGDNPLVSEELASLVVSTHERARADYSAFEGPPLGTGVEVVEFSAMERALSESEDPYDHEHVTPFLYRNPALFRTNRTTAPAEYCLDARVTLDTQEDFDHLEKVFDELYDGTPIPTLQLVAWLREQKENAYSPPA